MTALLIIPIIGAIWVSLSKEEGIRKKGLAVSIVTLLEAIRIAIGMDYESAELQAIYSWGKVIFGIDGISLIFVLLTAFLIPLCILVTWDTVELMRKQYIVALLIIEWLLMGVFTVMDILGFYVLYEGVLIPMFILIGVWGAREQKITAAYYFFMYTLLGSLLMLISILYLYTISGTTDLTVLMGYAFSKEVQIWIFLGLVASLAVKIPLYPFHVWLPQAHTEANVAGSVLLAGVLIKLGSYGLIRFAVGITPIACEYFAPVMFTLSILGVLYASITTLRQTDFKRIIAYSSVGHMGIVTIGIFALNTTGLEGSIYLQVAHGLVSSGLFIAVTLLYERYHTRIVKYYRGVTITMPIFSTMMGILTMANIGVPGTSNFVGEIMSLAGAMEVNTFVTILGAFGMVLSASYGLFLFNRVCFGSHSSYFIHPARDLSRREFFVLFPLIILTLIFGIWPELLLKPIHISVLYLLS